MVAISRERAKHGAMLLVHDKDDRGQERVIVLPLGSVVSYFTSRDDAPGVVLHVLPGFCVGKIVQTMIAHRMDRGMAPRFKRAGDYA
jgi:hypothetical protein